MFSNVLLTKPKNKEPIKPFETNACERITNIRYFSSGETDICAKRKFSGIQLVWQFVFDVFIRSSKETLTDTSSL